VREVKKESGKNIWEEMEGEKLGGEKYGKSYLEKGVAIVRMECSAAKGGWRG